MKLSIGDIIDRWAIAFLKHSRANIDTTPEINSYLDYINGKYNQKDVKDYFDKLLKVNGDIWWLESDIRKGKEGELGLEEVGRRALAIRDLNGNRVRFKNELNRKYNEGFEEIKVDHASKS